MIDGLDRSWIDRCCGCEEVFGWLVEILENLEIENRKPKQKIRQRKCKVKFKVLVKTTVKNNFASTITTHKFSLSRGVSPEYLQYM